MSVRLSFESFGLVSENFSPTSKSVKQNEIFDNFELGNQSTRKKVKFLMEGLGLNPSVTFIEGNRLGEQDDK